MKVDIEPYSGVGVVTPHGPLLRADVDEVRTAAASALERYQQRIVIDLHDVPYCDSAGIELLLALSEGLSRLERPRLALLQPTCLESLELTGAADHLEIVDGVDDGVRSLRR